MTEQTTLTSRRSYDGTARRPGTDSSTTASRADTVNERVSRRRTGLLSGERVGDYQLGELLGVGGMAEVYQAEDLVLQRWVAVKVLAAHLADDPEYADRFRAEARRVGALSHPHLVPVYQAGEAEVRGKRLLYLVMPLLQESLRDLRRREGKLSAAEAAWLVLQVADGLEVAHQSGIVHRDVKPGNVLLDMEGHTLLADFGIARELYDTSPGVAPTQSGLILGTPEYMAPEQLCGESLDQRADVYSLGAVFYELLTGQLAFIGATPYDLAAHALHAPLIPPSILEPGIAPALERVVLTALARDRAERYGSAGAFARALRDAIISSNEVPQSPRWDIGHSWAASHPRTFQTGMRRIRRQRRMWPQILLAAMLMFLLAGSGDLLALIQRGVGSMTSARTSSMFERASMIPAGHATPMAEQTPAATAPTVGAPPAGTPHTNVTPLSDKPGSKSGHKHSKSK